MTDTKLTQDEISRYARHIMLPEIGGLGQQRLKSAKVAVLGAGGLGSPIISYLAAAGVGTLGIIDDDHVSISNLQRQILHDSDKIGLAKVESSAQSVQRLNPHVDVQTHAVRLSADNSHDILQPYDIIVDGSDHFATRYILADCAEALKIPFVMGAVGRFDGSVTVFAPYLSDAKDNPNPRIYDLYPQAPPDGLLPNCAEAGVVGALTGVIGTLQAMEVIKLITQIGDPLIGRLLLYDGLSARFDEIKYRRKATTAR